ncbi:hypothetical protein HDV01_000287 [Terramyces sp. JEL0728]|nr:hypothetical protein HDV01_000287 [Terramyces sp. JEL0728]
MVISYLCFKILSYNIQQFPRNLPAVGPLHTPITTSDDRFKVLLQSDFLLAADVVVFTEAWDAEIAYQIKNYLRVQYPYQTDLLASNSRVEPEWNSTQLSGNTILNGGVFVASRYPILNREQFVYKVGSGFDRLASKGFVAVSLDYKLEGKKVHIYATHLQADNYDEAQKIRQVQFQSLIKHARLSIPKEDLVFVAGDLNVNLFSSEFKHIRKLGKIGELNYEGPYSYDPETNAYLRYMHCDESGETLDYGFPLGTHARLHSLWKTKVLLPKVADEYVVGGGFFDAGPKRWAAEASDHYPVLSYTADGVDSDPILYSTHKVTGDCPASNMSYFIFSLIIFPIVAVVAINRLYKWYKIKIVKEHLAKTYEATFETERLLLEGHSPV